MACSASKNSNLTALPTAKQLQQSFQRFCQTESNFIKNIKIDKNVRKLVVYHAKLEWL